MDDLEKIKTLKVTITLLNDQILDGTLNIIGYQRFSDFLEGDVKSNIQLFDVINGIGIKGATKRFVVIPKTSILYYEPFDEKRNLTHE